MRRSLSVLSAALLGALTLALPGPAAHAAGPALRIMPLGDSITDGVGSSTQSSYRADLWSSITGAGHALDFVGSNLTGALPDRDNEGHSGWRIEQISGMTTCAVATSRPNVVTLHLGTNDMNQNYEVASAPERLGTLVDRILAADPGVTVLVASLVPSTDAGVQSRIAAFNQRVPGLVAQRQNAGRHVRFVDMGAVTTADLADFLHPNDAGYRKMSAAFHRGLQDSIGAGWIAEPAAQVAGGCAHGTIRGTESGRCVDLPNGNQTPGTAIVVWDCNDGVNQLWTSTPDRQLLGYATKCLDAYGNGTADGTQVIIWDCTGGDNQRWTVQPDGTIVGVQSGKCLRSAAGNGSPLQIGACDGSAGQKWATSRLGVLRGQESGRCADSPGAATTNGTRPILWDCHGRANQTFAATPTGRLTVFTDKCLEARGTGDGAPVEIWECSGSAGQQWTLNADGTVVGAASGRCLEAAGHGTGNGTALQIWTCAGTPNQRWARS